MLEGWQWRQKQHVEEIRVQHELRMREYSVLASWITAPHVKKPLKPTDFYDPEKMKQIQENQAMNDKLKLETPEDKRKMLQDLESQMGVSK